MRLNFIVRDFLIEIMQMFTNRRLNHAALLMCMLLTKMQQDPEFKTGV